MKKQQRKTIYAKDPTGMRIVNVLSYDVLADGTLKLDVILESVQPEPEVDKNKDVFRLVDPNAIKWQEYFWDYETKSFYTRIFKDNLIKALDGNVRSFYCPIYAPSAYGSFIHFVKNEKPAVGHNFEWWSNAAKKFNPDANSRLGTKNEYIIFLAFLINQLIENGWEIEKAWSAVCNDSREIGNFLSRGPVLENTGSREIVGFYDLGNVTRIVLSDKEAGYCWIAGGSYKKASFINPLSNLDYYRIDNSPFEDAVGWVIYD